MVMPRFVILRHEVPANYPRGGHWDLMLEAGQTLRTWALCELPRQEREVSAEALAEHRLEYLGYEGPLSGERGSVRQFDQGTYQIRQETPVELVAEFHGGWLTGLLRFTRDSADERYWRIAFPDDRSFASSELGEAGADGTPEVPPSSVRPER